MRDILALIKQIREAHQVIVTNLTATGSALSDRSALLGLGRQQAAWTPGSFGDMEAGRQRLLDVFDRLKQGLDGHFKLEERAFPPLFGELMMRGLLAEHNDIRSELTQARDLIRQMDFSGLSHEAATQRQSDVQQALGALAMLIQDHATSEEAVLDLLQRGVEADGAPENGPS